MACDRPRSPQGPSCCCVHPPALSTPLLPCNPSHTYSLLYKHRQATCKHSPQLFIPPGPRVHLPSLFSLLAKLSPSALYAAGARETAFSPCHGRTTASLPVHTARTPSHKQPLELASNPQ